MPYPDQFPDLKFETTGSVRIVDIASRLPKHATKTYLSRSPWAIRKVLVHYHAGGPHGTATYAAKGADAGIPQSCINTANYAIAPDDPSTKDREGADFPGYAYHYDIGYKEHTENGIDYCFRTQDETKASYHTGHSQNEMGVAISHYGGMRELWNPTGQFATPDEGRVSPFQRRVFPVVLKYLQDKHRISNLHVEGHFQHEKPACPGWDLEYWIMRHENKVRESGKGWCWPINPDAGNAAAFVPLDNAKAVTQAKRLVSNNLQGGSGLFPVSRRYTWHDGVHLFGKAGQSVHAVHDGWVVGARVNKSYKDDKGNEFGSANFVLVLHEDPGLCDPLDARTFVGDRVPIPLRWFSLYMHLSPLDDKVDWVARLKQRDAARHKKLTADKPEDALNLSGVAIPVKAGDVIGTIGTHNPFAARPAGATAKNAAVYEASRHAVLHFEIFSSQNLLERFHPDPELFKKWTVEDPNANVYADEFLTRLAKLKGITASDLDTIKKASEEAEAEDPQQQDVSAWSSRVTPAMNNLLSQVICKHVSEWNADFDSVATSRAKAWGLDNSGVAAVKKLVAAFKWWGAVYKSDASYKAADTMLPAGAVSHHYHPIRILCWLAGLKRVLDHAPTGGEDSDGFPLSTNIYADMTLTLTKFLRAEAAAGAKEILIESTMPEERLRGSSVRFANHPQVYELDSFSKVMSKGTFVEWRVVLKTPLSKKVEKTTRYKLGNYGWHFEAEFDWNTPLD